MRNIKDLIDCEYNFLVEGIVDDSRLVEKNYIFVATKGANVDHYNYISDAIEKGCCFLVVDREISINFPHIVVNNINDYYKNICLKFYNISLSNFHFIGITGTDGKTTTATIVKEVLDSCAYIGTNGLSIQDTYYKTNNTTPCINELYKDLSIIQENKISNVVLEVSSEALLHNRVDNFNFDIVAFTNITGDHLNVHKSFQNYLECKLKLLELVRKNGYVIVNGDDSNLQSIKCKNMYTFGFLPVNDFVISDVKNMSNYVLFSIRYLDKIYYLRSPFVGKYNIYNVALGFIIGYFYGVDVNILIDRICHLKPVSGRGEKLSFGQKYDIILDYAHTINGIKSVLDAYSHYDNVIVVSGCAGGRDKSKRNIIGNFLMEKSDVCIFTMDDPRFENVDHIIDDMAGNNNNYIRILDRKDAIYYALSIAKENSVVLILGKGRDNYMAIKDKKVPYCDFDVIKSYFEM